MSTEDGPSAAIPSHTPIQHLGHLNGAKKLPLVEVWSRKPAQSAQKAVKIRNFGVFSGLNETKTAMCSHMRGVKGGV